VAFDALPADVQQAAREKFKLWRRDPFHPSLQFKQLKKELWSVRITASYRALGLRNGEEIIWFWIGTHREYDKLIQRF